MKRSDDGKHWLLWLDKHIAEPYFCANCGHAVALDRHLRCEVCASDSVTPFESSCRPLDLGGSEASWAQYGGRASLQVTSDTPASGPRACQP